MKTQRVELLFFLSLTLALDEAGSKTSRSSRFSSKKESQYPLYRRLDRPQSAEYLSSTGFRSPDGPALTSCYAVYAVLVEYQYLRLQSQYTWNNGNKNYFDYLHVINVKTGSLS
jgi:hypothetical protein